MGFPKRFPTHKSHISHRFKISPNLCYCRICVARTLLSLDKLVKKGGGKALVQRAGFGRELWGAVFVQFGRWLREIETGASVASKQYQQQEDEKYGDMFIFLDGKVFKVIKSNTGQERKTKKEQITSDQEKAKKQITYWQRAGSPELGPSSEMLAQAWNNFQPANNLFGKFCIDHIRFFWKSSFFKGGK